MHYYIDGYNLLFRVLKAGDDIRKQREELITELEKKVNLLGIDATLVFDSHYQEDDYVRSHYKSLTIIYTAKGQSADECILHELKACADPSKHTVVTSDKKLATLCRLRLSKTETIDEFLSLIGKRYKNKLRNKRGDKADAQAAISLEKAPPPPVEVKKPTAAPASTVHEASQNCFDYYLQSFEKEFEQIEQANPPKKQELTKPKKPKIPPRQLTKEETQLSNFDRWQKAFERPLGNDTDA